MEQSSRRSRIAEAKATWASWETYKTLMYWAFRKFYVEVRQPFIREAMIKYHHTNRAWEREGAVVRNVSDVVNADIAPLTPEERERERERASETARLAKKPVWDIADLSPWGR